MASTHAEPTPRRFVSAPIDVAEHGADLIRKAAIKAPGNLGNRRAVVPFHALSRERSVLVRGAAIRIPAVQQTPRGPR